MEASKRAPGFGGFIRWTKEEEEEDVDDGDNGDGEHAAAAAAAAAETSDGRCVDVTLRARRVGSKRVELYGPLTERGHPVSFWRRT